MCLIQKDNASVISVQRCVHESQSGLQMAQSRENDTTTDDQTQPTNQWKGSICQYFFIRRWTYCSRKTSRYLFVQTVKTHVIVSRKYKVKQTICSFPTLILKLYILQELLSFKAGKRVPFQWKYIFFTPIF